MNQYAFIVSLFLLLLTPYTTAQISERPLTLPVALEPGPSTWLFGQAYGNTTGAYNFGTAWYSSGQGLHFGIDLPMPCGTPLVAVADGEVVHVDNLNFGSGPHNLLLIHRDLGIATLYGHMLEPSPLVRNQAVRQGDLVGFSGDPDVTCDSRPHLHFEVRSTDFYTTYNPITYIDANWHSLATIGGYGYPLFQQDLDNARQWMTLEDQPDVRFGGARLNAYSATWPLPNTLRPPANPPLDRPFAPLPADTKWSIRRIGYDQCCWRRWWDPLDADKLYVIDGQPGQRAGIYIWSAAQGMMTGVVGNAPPAITSPDGTYQIFNNGNQVVIRSAINEAEQYTVQTQGVTPALSTDNRLLTWTIRSGMTIPGQAQRESSVWISDLSGANVREILSDRGISAQWLDSHRLLVGQSGEGRLTTFSIFDTRDDSSYTLGTWRNLRGLSVSPGGGHLMFMLMWQEDPVNDGVYVLETVPNAQPQKLPWFGGWRWRDAESVYYLPLNPDSPYHTLKVYHIPSSEDRMLVSSETLPFTIMNSDWDVSADGRRIVFQNAEDWNMWLLEMSE